MLTAVTRFAKPMTVTTMPLSTPGFEAITTTSATTHARLADSMLELQHLANEVCWEMYLYHRHQPEFRATYKSARQIWNLAGGMHEAVHRHPEAIAQAATPFGEVRRLLHEIVDDVAAWSMLAPGLIPATGPARLMRRGGTLKTLHAKLRALEELLQEITEESLSPTVVRDDSPLIE